MPKHHISLPVREQVRGRAGNQCEICGISISTEFDENDDQFASMHHRYPRRDGGRDIVSNLIFSCRKCHLLIHQDEDAAVVQGWICVDNRTENVPVRIRSGWMYLGRRGQYLAVLDPAHV